MALYPLFLAGLLRGHFGEDPGAGQLRISAVLMFVGWALVGAGPIKVWLRRRRLVWLLAGLLCLVIGSVWAIDLLLESLGAN
ncbi:MAG: hypothetical protein M3131_03085 [Actinomycetota bacterium]|nr:hypothetical protein [Actinomycetota bacterium]